MSRSSASIGERESKFVQPSYHWRGERDVLSLTGRDPAKTSYHFDRRAE